MPVRIYDIAKKLGIESKDVLVKAKELGIAEARVASSSLDKITAEYLEKELGGQPSSDEPAPAPHPVEPMSIIKAPPPEPEPVIPPAPIFIHEPEPVVEQAPEFVEQEPSVEEAPAAAPLAESAEIAPAEPAPVQPVAQDAGSVTPPAPAPTAAPAPAPVPAPAPIKPPVAPGAPKIGDKIGFIQLPTRPRPPERGDQRPGQQARPAPGAPNRPDQQRGGRDFPPRPGQGQNRPGFAPRPGQAPAKPSEPKFVAPAGGQLITMKPPIIVRDLAEQLKQKAFKVIADLMELGVFANVNQSIDESIAQRLCGKYGFRFEVEKRERGGGIVHAPVKKIVEEIDDKPEDLKPRPPVVTIMGHVDHGKTTLLDVIRKSDVAQGEAGGITQHIGAYTISFPHPERKKDIQQITFLDTPGHAAFSAMRARGANVTDLVVLVVAANDGVMPQTLEALSHAKAAKVPILVAVNKCDHPNANPMRVRQQLQEKGLVPDDWGGDTIYVDVSAVTKKGVDKLLEMILLQADLLELKANPNRRSKGNVIESGLQPGGPTATVLVRKGTLKVGDVILCGQYYGKVRALINEEGKRQQEATPSVAVKVLGLNGVPDAGAEFTVVASERDARDEAEKREMADKAEGALEARSKVTLENLFATLAENSAKTFKAVVKGDTQGSVEAIVDALKKIDTEKVSLEIIHSAVGTITESDVLLASASKAVILGFHTRIDNGVADVAKREGVQIKLYTIIYELIDEVVLAMAGLLDPVTKENVVGAAEVRQVFELSKGGNVAGCMVTSGRLVKGKLRVVRRKNLLFDGATLSLRRFQDEVNEVRAGMECGIRLDGFNDFQVGDTIECYVIEKVAQKL